MASERRSPDEEWEYEYDENETEVFLIDLDLTTVNRTIRSTTANRHKKLKEISDKPASKRRKLSAKSGNDATVDDQAEVIQDRNDDQPEQEHLDPEQNSPSLGEGQDDTMSRQHTLQVLDLHTANPIVSYQGQIFSCKWTDMMGTTMFFSQDQDTPLSEPLLSTSDFDMIGTSRIKLVGTAAKVTPAPQTSQENNKANVPRPGQSLGTIRRTNAKLNADLRKQASFLEQLMKIKKNRGESDNVLVAVSDKMSVAGQIASTASVQPEEIKELNRKAVRGDGEAFRKLEKMYLARCPTNDRSLQDGTPDAPAIPQNTSSQLELHDTDAEHEIDVEVDVQSGMITADVSSRLQSPNYVPPLGPNPEVANNDNG
ncbi:hypothetical protein LTR64_002416 [Lithohypha guttulata]|uniref:uncharacterized protein n=1 Tax=Lithohypha guttulata TaxID=1690604 RepID=UPI002DDF935C|nr:hypothetical protein LTR51_001359 [Lithohypha guttulata]